MIPITVAVTITDIRMVNRSSLLVSTLSAPPYVREASFSPKSLSPSLSLLDVTIIAVFVVVTADAVVSIIVVTSIVVDGECDMYMDALIQSSFSTLVVAISLNVGTLTPSSSVTGNIVAGKQLIIILFYNTRVLLLTPTHPIRLFGFVLKGKSQHLSPPNYPKSKTSDVDVYDYNVIKLLSYSSFSHFF